MKKFFALVLAVAMIMSMAAVSMAADVVLGAAYDYSADSNVMTEAKGFVEGKDLTTVDQKIAVKGALFTYGDTVYYPIQIAGYYVEDYALVEKLKVKVSYEMGEELIDNVSIVKMNVAKLTEWDVNTNEELVETVVPNVDGYIYFVAFKTNKQTTTADGDVVGTLEFNRKTIKNDDAPASVKTLLKGTDAEKALAKTILSEVEDCEVDFQFNLFYENSWLGGAKRGMLVDTDEVALKWDTDYALKFEGDDEVEFTFGTEENEGSYTVDISGQGKLYLRYNTKADEAIAAANPGVDMHFVNFNGAKFNRTGEFVYEMEDVVAAYKVVDGALVEIPGLEIEDDEVFFNTRVLESYVFADAELVNPVVEAPVVEAPAVTNPTTGA